MKAGCCECRSFDNSSNTPSSGDILSGESVASFLTKSVNFDGVDEYANAPAPSLDLTEDFSIAVWVKPDNNAFIFSRVIQTPGVGVDGWLRAYSLGLGGNTNLHNATSNSYRMSFGVDDGFTETVRFTSEPVVRPDIWTHVVAVWAGGSITIYINGVSQMLYVGPNINYVEVGHPGLVIGWHGGIDTNTPWRGNLCDLSIVNRAITDIEAANLAVKTVDLLTHTINDELKAWWKLGDGDTHPTLFDSKGSNNLTMVNMEADDIQDVIPFPNNPSPHTNTHTVLNTDPLIQEAGGVGYPILWEHFMIQSASSLDLGIGWGIGYSNSPNQIRWYGAEPGHPGVVTLDTLGLNSSNTFASLLFGGDADELQPIWNYVLNVPHVATDPDPGPLKIEWLVKFSRVTPTQIERAVFGWGDRFLTPSPMTGHQNGFYIEFDPALSSRFRLIAVSGGVGTTVTGDTTDVAADTWYKIGAELRYEVLTGAATTYSPLITLLVNDIDEGSTSSITTLPDSTANIGFGVRFDGGTAPVGTQDANNNYKTPTVPYVGIDWVRITQITSGPGASLTTTPYVFNAYSTLFGGNEYVDLGASQFLTSGAAHTISIWFKLPDFSVPNPIVLKLLTNNSYYLVLISNNGSYLDVTWGSDDAAWGTFRAPLISAPTGFLDVWNHIVITHDGGGTVPGNYLFYHDAVSNTVTTSDLLDVPTGNSTIGSDGNTGTFSNTWNGHLDEISIWNVALNITQIRELYNTGTPINLATHSVTGNLTHWWRMGDDDIDIGNNSIITDQIGSAHGTTSGATSFEVDSAPTFNKYSQLFTGGYVDLPSSVAIGLGGLGAITMSVWILRSSIGAIGTIIELTIVNEISKVLMDIRADNTISVGGRSHWFGLTPLQNAVTSSTFTSTVNWYHIVGIINVSDDNIDIYVDGIQQATTGSPAWSSSVFSSQTGPDHRIGQDTFIIPGVFDGNIDDVSIWNRVLTNSEVTELYSAGPTDLSSHSAYSSLLHWWRMGDGDVNIGVGSTITDQRGSADGTTTGNTTFDIAYP